MSDILCAYDGQRDEVIVAYLYGELTADERALFTRHLTRCVVCQREIEALGDVRAELAEWSLPDNGAIVDRQLVSVPSLRSVGSLPSSEKSSSEKSSSEKAIGTKPLVVPEPSRPRSAWREIPRWAQFAAAMLFMGMAAGIANLNVTYGRDGLSVRTGWSARPSEKAVPLAGGAAADAAADAAVITQSDLTALAAQLHAELQSGLQAQASTAATPASTPVPAASNTNQELILRVRELIRDSEQRQKRELALRVAEVAQDAQVQRQADLVRIDRTLGALQNTTGSAVRRQEQMLNSLAVRVSQKQ